MLSNRMKTGLNKAGKNITERGIIFHRRDASCSQQDRGGISYMVAARMHTLNHRSSFARSLHDEALAQHCYFFGTRDEVVGRRGPGTKMSAGNTTTTFQRKNVVIRKLTARQ